MIEFTPEWIETLKERYSDVEGNTKVITRLFEALNEIERLQSRVQELEAAQRWIPVTMTGQEPEIGQRILTIDMDDNIYAEEYLGHFYDLITYWKPVYRPDGYLKYDDLPQPPKDGNE